MRVPCAAFGLLLGCLPCRGEIATSEPEAWAAPVLQCAERRDVRPITVDDRCNAYPSDEPPERPQKSTNVLVAPGPEGMHWVWVRTQAHADGDAGGPIALVEVEGRAATLHAIGWLRASPKALRIELAGDWLVIHDESSVQLLHRSRGDLDELVSAEPGVDCRTPARYAIREQGRRSLDDYVRREFAIERSLIFVDDQPVIHEHLRVHDLDPRPAAEPDTLVQEAELDRPLVLEGRVLRVSAGLWTQTEGEIDLDPGFPRLRHR